MRLSVLKVCALEKGRERVWAGFRKYEANCFIYTFNTFVHNSHIIIVEVYFLTLHQYDVGYSLSTGRKILSSSLTTYY
jgi:hypothetical protein